jgi:hypothetical protein
MFQISQIFRRKARKTGGSGDYSWGSCLIRAAGVVLIQADYMAKTPQSPEPVIHWHPAFFEAIQLELESYRDILEFKAEYQLSAEPLRIDVLIVKKLKDAAIKKNIGAIFRGDNRACSKTRLVLEQPQYTGI